jgi:hypothetical protein
MKVLTVLVLIFALSEVSPLASQAGTQDQGSSITLYSSLRGWKPGQPRTQPDRSRTYFSFASGKYEPGCCDWDLSYGQIYLGDDQDWFLLNATRDNRSVIKDLGEHSWSSRFKVSALKPLPLLKKGEERRLAIDTSGRPGAIGTGDRLSALDGDHLNAWSAGSIPRGAVADDGDRPGFPSSLGAVSTAKAKPKKLTNLPVLVKAIEDHMYLIHLVKPTLDQYFLVHVDAVVNGETCTFSWKQIPAPK